VSLDIHPIVDALAAARHEPGSMKAATMTFAVFLGDAASSGWVRDRTRALADKHPSRVVIFDASKDGRERLVEPSGSRGEWIEIGVKEADASELGAALAMLELPEAPVILLWIADGLSTDERFLALARRANATICSSSVTHTDERPLRDLIGFIDLHPEIVIHDISYLRLVSWQELIAEFFDEPECRRELAVLRSIEVTAGSDAEMYYLLGWLASRLAWTPAASGVLASSSGPVKFELVHDGPPRRLSKVVLASEHATFSAAVQANDLNAICLDVTGTTTCGSRCTPVHTVDLASLVERAILSRTRDEVFIESLTMAKHIIDRQAV